MREKLARGSTALKPSPETARRRTEALRLAARRYHLAPGADEPPCAGTAKRIFVSYAHANKRRVTRFVAWLEQMEFIVAWDREFHAGDDFHQSISENIQAADAVVVVWSAASAGSRFVRDEASRALRLDKLVCVHVPGFAPDDLPLGLGHLHTVGISDQAAILKSLARLTS